MLTTIADQVQNQLQDGSCLLIAAPQTAAAAAINKTALTAGSTALKTGTATGTAAALALSAGTVAATIFGVLVIGVMAYGTNVVVRAYVD